VMGKELGTGQEAADDLKQKEPHPTQPSISSLSPPPTSLEPRAMRVRRWGGVGWVVYPYLSQSHCRQSL
jgi:hypothetical protein